MRMCTMLPFLLGKVAATLEASSLLAAGTLCWVTPSLGPVMNKEKPHSVIQQPPARQGPATMDT